MTYANDCIHTLVNALVIEGMKPTFATCIRMVGWKGTFWILTHRREARRAFIAHTISLSRFL